MAVASAGPYASLHLAPDKQPRQHPTTQFFTGRMPFLPPNQQRQSTKGNKHWRQRAPPPTANKIAENLSLTFLMKHLLQIYIV